MTDYECFFVVGAPPVRCIRQAIFRDESVKKAYDLDERRPRRRKLRPETLVAFPGSSGGSVDREVRPGTTLEAAICQFCFPAGYVTVEEVSGELSRHMEAEDSFNFTLKLSALEKDRVDTDECLWCTALRQKEVIRVKRLFPQLCDLEEFLSSDSRETLSTVGPRNVKMKRADRQAKKRILELALSLGHPNQRDHSVTWQLPYCYVFVSRKAQHLLSKTILQLFRGLCLSGTSPGAVTEVTGGVTTLDFCHAQGLAAMNWARRANPPLMFEAAKIFIGVLLDLSPAGENQTSLLQLHSYVENLSGWIAPLLPVTVPPVARAIMSLIMHRHSPKVDQLIDFIRQNNIPPDYSQQETLLDILKTSGLRGPLAPYAARSLTGLEEFMASLRGSLVAERNVHEVINGCDHMFPVIFECIPSRILAWLMFMALLETKVIVSSGSALRRSSMTFILKAAIFPHAWEHPHIPIVPSSVGDDIGDSPFPCIAALRRFRPIQSNEIIAYLTENEPVSDTEETPCKKKRKGCVNHNCGRCGYHTDNRHERHKCYLHKHLHLIHQLTRAPDLPTAPTGSRSPQKELISSPESTVASPLCSNDRFAVLGGTAALARSKSCRSNAVEAWLRKNSQADPAHHATCCIWRSATSRCKADADPWKVGIWTEDDSCLASIPPSTRLDQNGKLILIPKKVLAMLGDALDALESPSGDESLRLLLSRRTTVASPPWPSIVEGMRMEPSKETTYVEDYCFVLEKHWAAQIPKWFHITSAHNRDLRRVIDDSAVNLRICPFGIGAFDDAKETSSGIFLPLFLVPVARGMAMIKMRTDQVVQAQRRECEAIRLAQGLLESYMWSIRQSDCPSSCDLAELTAKVAEWTTLVQTYEEDCRELESLASLATLSFWQCALSWPTRLIQRLFAAWFGDQHTLSRLVTCRRDRIGKLLGTQKRAYRTAQSCFPTSKLIFNKGRQASLPAAHSPAVSRPRRSRTLSLALAIPRLQLDGIRTPHSAAVSFSSSFTSASPISPCSATALSGARERTRETPHGTPVRAYESVRQKLRQKRRNTHDVQLQWSYFTHAYLLSNVFEKFADAQKPGRLGLRSSQETLNEAWDMFETQSNELVERLPSSVDPCDCCCDIAEKSVHCQEAAQMLRKHLAQCCTAPVPPMRSSILQSMFLRRKNGDALKEVARALAHLEGEICNVSETGLSSVDEITKEYKSSLKQLVSAHASLIKRASNLAGQLSQPGADGSLVDSASTLVEELLGLSTSQFAEDAEACVEDENGVVVEDWMLSWQHTCVVLSQWKVYLGSFYDTQMFQSDLEEILSELRGGQDGDTCLSQNAL